MSLHIESAGQGSDVVLIHGWGMHGGVWSDVRDQLASSHRVHVVDLPGMGLSGATTPYNLQRLADILANELPQNAAVVGWSFGGQVAMRMALDYPEQVSRLVLVGSTPRFVNAEGWQAGMPADVFRQFAAQVASDYHETMTRFLGLQAFGGDASRTLLRDLRERFFTRPMPRESVLQEALRILLETDLRAELPRIAQPVLLIHGERDTLAPVAASRWMAEHLPNAQLQVIPRGTHAPFLSHPAGFMAALDVFLNPISVETGT